MLSWKKCYGLETDNSEPLNQCEGNHGSLAQSLWPRDRLLRPTHHGSMHRHAARAAADPGKGGSAAAVEAEAVDSAAAGCVAATSPTSCPAKTTPSNNLSNCLSLITFFFFLDAQTKIENLSSLICDRIFQPQNITRFPLVCHTEKYCPLYI